MNGEMLIQGCSVKTEEQKLKAEAKANTGAWKRRTGTRPEVGKGDLVD